MNAEQREANPGDIRSELDRKVWECLEKSARHYSQGKIGSEALSAATRAAWEIAAGLCSDPINEMITEAAKVVQKHEATQTRTFRNVVDGMFACAVSWTPGDDKVRVLKPGGDSITNQYEDALSAKERFTLLGDRLATQYEEW